MAKITSKVYKSSIVEALTKRNVPFLRLVNTSYLQAGYGYKQKRFAYSDINESVSAIMSEQKNLTRELLDKCGVRIPKGVGVKTWDEVKAAYDKLKKPVVIKPVSEMWGKGVTVEIYKIKELEKAFKIAKEFSEKIIIEEQIKGEDNRILIINNKFVAGLKRMKPYVIGDGKKNIEDLIKEENEKRKKSGKHIKDIMIEKTVHSALAEQNYTLKSTPKEGVKVLVRMTGNISSGGISEDVTDKVHPENIELAKQITRYLSLDIAGLDFLTTDISKPLKETGGAVTEVNQNPDVAMHQNPYIGEPKMTAELLVDYIFPKPEEIWIPIWHLGKKIKDQKIIDKHLNEVPKKVKQFQAKDFKREVEINEPKEKLYNYLIDPLTCEIYI